MTDKEILDKAVKEIRKEIDALQSLERTITYTGESVIVKKLKWALSLLQPNPIAKVGDTIEWTMEAGDFGNHPGGTYRAKVLVVREDREDYGVYVEYWDGDQTQDYIPFDEATIVQPNQSNSTPLEEEKKVCNCKQQCQGQEPEYQCKLILSA